PNSRRPPTPTLVQRKSGLPDMRKMKMRNRGRPRWRWGGSRLCCAETLAFLIRLEPRQIRKGELAAVDVHAAQLGAAVQGRKHLAGIEQPLCVEGAFQPLLLV